MGIHLLTMEKKQKLLESVGQMFLRITVLDYPLIYMVLNKLSFHIVLSNKCKNMLTKRCVRRT